MCPMALKYSSDVLFPDIIELKFKVMASKIFLKHGEPPPPSPGKPLIVF